MQTSHPPAHALLQQTPSAQWVEAHWPPLLHGAPRARSVPPQVPATHWREAHWRFDEHASPLSRAGTQAPAAQ